MMSFSFTTMENMDSISEEQMEKMLHIFDIPSTKDDIPTSTPGEKIKLPKLTIRLTPKVSSISSVFSSCLYGADMNKQRPGKTGSRQF